MASDSSTIKVVVLGAGYQGKSALILRFVSGMFVNEYDPTIEDNYSKLIVVDEEAVLLDILDTAGEEEYASMMDQWMYEGQIFILIYAVDSERHNDEASDTLTPYEQCSALRERVVKLKSDENIPFILVGAKCDIPSDQRTYSKEDGESLATELQCPYVEVSAKTNHNLDVLWDKVVIEYTKYATCHLPTRSFTLSLRNPPSDIAAEPTAPCYACCSCLKPSVSPRDIDSLDIISSAKYTAMNANNKSSKHRHTRVNTGSEMIPMGDIAIAIEEKDVMNELKAVNEEDPDDEEVLRQIAEMVIAQPTLSNTNQTEDNEKEKEASVEASIEPSGSSEVDEEDDEDESERKEAAYIPQIHSLSRVLTTTQVKLFPVVNLPADDKTFEPILSSKHWNIRRRFYWKRFMISILCGVFLPLVLWLQTLAFLCYVEGRKGGFYYPKRYKYAHMHRAVLLDFMGIVIGRKPNQDPEIERDRKWFLRQTMTQKVKRVMLSVWMCFVYLICIYNVHCAVHQSEYQLRVSLMETLGPLLLLSVLWILLSLWIAYESKLKPSRPPLTKLRCVNLYFGHKLDQTTSAYKFCRGYIASIDNYYNENQCKVSFGSMAMMILLAAFYGCIPGLTRFFIGDDSDGLESTKQFITYKEMKVEVGALIVNMFLMIAVMYTVSVQHKKYLHNYREWMYELTMFLVSNRQRISTGNGDGDEDDASMQPDMDQLDDDFDDAEDLFQYYGEEDSFSLNRNGRHMRTTKSIYFPQKMYLSLKRKSNVFGFLEIRSFLESQGKLFFGEQELPLLWMMAITVSLTIFILYRVFFMAGNPIQSVLWNGVSLLVLVCLMFLVQIMIIAHHFDDLQIKQESFIEMQKWILRCTANDEESSLNNISLVHDMLSLVKRKDIYPKIYGMKLNSVLLPLIAIVVISAIITVVKLFLAVLLF